MVARSSNVSARNSVLIGEAAGGFGSMARAARMWHGGGKWYGLPAYFAAAMLGAYHGVPAAHYRPITQLMAANC